MQAAHSRRSLWLGLRVLAGTVTVTVAGVGVVAAQAEPGHSSASLRPDKKPPKTTPVTTPVVPTSGIGIPSPAPSRTNGVIDARADTLTLSSKTETLIRVPDAAIEIYALDSRTPDGTIQQNLAWVISNPPTTAHHPPAAIVYGTFPSVRLSTLAFGSIPLTLTLTLHQLIGTTGRFKGVYEPLDAAYNTSGSLYTLGGGLDTVLSDVSIDGIPVNLSSTCRTVTPAQLSARANGISGTPGYYNPYFGGQFQGNVVVPAFTGCTARPGGVGPPQDINALLDGTVSGAANATFVSQGIFGQVNGDFPYFCQPIQAGGCLAPPPLPTITGPTPVPTVSNPGAYPTPSPSG